MIFGYEVGTRRISIYPFPARHTAEGKFGCVLVYASESFVARGPLTVGHHLKRELIADIDPGVIACPSVCGHLSSGVLQKQCGLCTVFGRHAHIRGTWAIIPILN